MLLLFNILDYQTWEEQRSVWRKNDAQPTFQDKRQRWSILTSADWEGPTLAHIK